MPVGRWGVKKSWDSSPGQRRAGEDWGDSDHLLSRRSVTMTRANVEPRGKENVDYDRVDLEENRANFPPIPNTKA